MEFDVEAELAADTRFVISDDKAAEWAMRKVIESQQERDRLLKLVDDEQERLKKKREKILMRYEDDTSFLSGCLQDYMGRVKCRELKASRKYQLLSGTLVIKRGGTEYKRDDNALVGWLERNGRDDLVKVSKSPNWSEVKKLIRVYDGGVVVDADTGEVVDCITAEEKPDTFMIEAVKE